MGLYQSALSAVAVLAPEMSVLPMAAALWFHSERLTGCFVVLGFLLWYHVGIREAWNVRNPLQDYAGQDLADAQQVYNGIYVSCALCAALVGGLVAYITGLRGVWPLYAALPHDPAEDADAKLVKRSMRANVIAHDLGYRSGLARWGFSNIAPPTAHVFVTLLLFLFTVVLPHLIFSLVFASSAWGAFGAALGVLLLGYALTWVYWAWNTDLYVWGPCERNTKKRDEADEGMPADAKLRKTIFARTRYRVLKNVLIMALLHCVGFLVVAGAVTFPTTADVDAAWITAVCFTGGVLLLALIVGAYFYTTRPSDERDAARKALEEGHRDDEVTLPPQDAEGSAYPSTRIDMRFSRVIGSLMSSRVK